MTRSLPSFGVFVLSLLVVATTACDQTDAAITVTGPAPLTANIGVRTSFGVEPSILRSEVLPGSCGVQAPFGVRLSVTVRGDHDLIIVRALRFSFVDRFGVRSLPEIITLPSLSTPLPSLGTLPSSSPIPIPGIAPLPTSAPIPIPGASPITGVLIDAGSRHRLNFFLRLGCGVASDGVIVIIIDAADRHGRSDTFELRARVGT